MKAENIEDIYELAPIQKGILFHSLFAPELGLYLFQMPFLLRGNLNIDAFYSAWQQVAERHASLRTGFFWEDINKPLQVVYRQVKVPLEQRDLRGLTLAEQEEQLTAFLESDRALGFDLSQECLMRLTLFRITDNYYQFIWSRHFIVMDGWSIPLILAEVMQFYEAMCYGKKLNLAASLPYRDYIEWLQKQDAGKAEAYWRQAIGELRSPTSLTHLDASSASCSPEKYDEQRIYLSPETTAALQSFSRQHQLTLSTIFQGLWAILLSYYSGGRKVLYGCTVAGRPLELVQDQPLIGLFVNSLPVWVEVDSDRSLLSWLRQLQEQLLEMRQYEWSPLVDIQGWSQVPRNQPLFESILVYENAPVDSLLQQWQGELEILNSTIFSNAPNFYKTNYPLTVAVYPDLKFCIGINYDFRRFDLATIAHILEDFERLIQDVLVEPNALLKDLLIRLDREYPIALTLEREVTFDFESSAA
ncbi:MAG: condensation domain-containing protein [Actinomycetota bacterium]